MPPQLELSGGATTGAKMDDLYVEDLAIAFQDKWPWYLSRKDAKRVIRIVFGVIRQEVRQNRTISIPGFGKFEPRFRKTSKGEGMHIGFKPFRGSKWHR